MSDQPPAWRMYEEQIYRSLRARAAPNASVSFDKDGTQRMAGRFSKINRQIDVIVRGTFAGLDGEHIMIVDCKCINRKIDVSVVEAFAGLVDDVSAQLGLL